MAEEFRFNPFSVAPFDVISVEDLSTYVNAVSDTVSIDLTLAGQSISGVVLPAGVDHNLLLNTHNLTSDIQLGSIGITGFTAGSVLFAGASAVSQDNANLYWNDTLNSLGIGTNAPAQQVHIKSAASGNYILTETTAVDGATGFQFKNDAVTWDFSLKGLNQDALVLKQSAPGEQTIFTIYPNIGGLYGSLIIGGGTFGLDGTMRTSATNTVVDAMNLNVDTSGTPANGLGTGLLFSTDRAGGTISSSGRIASVWTDVTAGSLDSDMEFYLREANILGKKMTLKNTGELQLIGDLNVSTKNIVTDITTGTKVFSASTQKGAFFGATPIVQPINTTDLKDAFVNLGLLATGGATPLNLDGGALTTSLVTVASYDGIDIYGGTDANHDLITLQGVTATPKLSWNATDTEFVFDDDVRINSSLGIGIKHDANYQLLTYGTNSVIESQSGGIGDNYAKTQLKNNAGLILSYTMYGSGVTWTRFGLSLANVAEILQPYGNASAFLIGTDGGTCPIIIGTANVERMRITSGGVVSMGGAVASPLAQFDITQPSVTAAIPVLELDQDDVSEPFVNFAGQETADLLSSISTLTTEGGTKKYVQVKLNGVQYWLRACSAPTA